MKKKMILIVQAVSIIIILSAVLISFDLEEKSNKTKWKALCLMIISSLGYAIYFILFDVAIRNSPYNSCAFWYQMGFLLLGIILISIKSFRKFFICSLIYKFTSYHINYLFLFRLVEV